MTSQCLLQLNGTWCSGGHSVEDRSLGERARLWGSRGQQVFVRVGLSRASGRAPW